MDTYSLAQFNDRLKIDSVVWSVQRNDELSGDGGGSVWTAELAPLLWTAEVSFADLYHHEAKQLAALIRHLMQPGGSFLLCDPISRYPQYDPAGAALGASTVQLETIEIGGAAVSFSGLPAGYRLTIGDKFSLTYGANPTRYGFFEIVENTQADASGKTGEVLVTPNIHTGVAIGTTVQLARPACRMMFIPESHHPGTARGLITSGGGFKALQKR